MFRRCISELSRSRSPLQRFPSQNSYFLYSRKEFSASSGQKKPHVFSSGKEFSASSRQNVSQKPSGSGGKTPEPVGRSPEPNNSNMVKLVLGGVLISGAVAAVAYQNMYLDKPKTGEESGDFYGSKKISKDGEVPKDIGRLEEQVTVNDHEASVPNNKEAHVEENREAHLDISQSLDQIKGEASESQVQNGLNVTPGVDAVQAQQNELPSSSQGDISSDNQMTHSGILPGDVIDKKEVGYGSTTAEIIMGENNVVNSTSNSQEVKVVSGETEIKAPSADNLTLQDVPEASLVSGAEPPSSLIDVYHLGEKDGQSNAISLDGKVDGSVPEAKEEKVSVGMSEELKGGYITKDGHLALDFLEAIHAAEKRQAELDAHILAEEKRILKEKYEKELNEARARELVHAEQAAMLDKELNNERTKAATTVKILQEKAEENLKEELERKESEAELQLKKVKELAKAELAAAIASEKASQIEKMAEANLSIDALCMAFYARSEEAQQSHSVHKLALGALALEDALSKGLPIQTEITALRTYIDGIDKDLLLNLVLSSLPEETVHHGTETQLQLNQKFNSLKATLRHYSLIPPGGGGILTHTIAHIASGLKVKENDVSGDGIESTINRVESLLAEGKLAEAADALEGGVSGSKAEELVGEWVKRARDRAIAEQALILLQSYATSISIS